MKKNNTASLRRATIPKSVSIVWRRKATRLWEKPFYIKRPYWLSPIVITSPTLGTDRAPFRRRAKITQPIPPPAYFTLRMEETWSSETFVLAYKTTQYQNPQDHNLKNDMALNKINISCCVLDITYFVCTVSGKIKLRRKLCENLSEEMKKNIKICPTLLSRHKPKAI